MNGLTGVDAGRRGMLFTADELVTVIEALREYRLRVADASRRAICDALIFRFGQQLVDQAKDAYLND